MRASPLPLPHLRSSSPRPLFLSCSSTSSPPSVAAPAAPSAGVSARSCPSRRLNHRPEIPVTPWPEGAGRRVSAEMYGLPATLLSPAVAGSLCRVVVVVVHDEAGEMKASPSVTLPWRGTTARTVLPTVATARTVRYDAGNHLPHDPSPSFMPRSQVSTIQTAGGGNACLFFCAVCSTRTEPLSLTVPALFFFCSDVGWFGFINQHILYQRIISDSLEYCFGFRQEKIWLDICPIVACTLSLSVGIFKEVAFKHPHRRLISSLVY